MAGIVAIIGRPNAGKSSLFNRLTGTKEAIVDDIPGVTRDRLYGECEYEGRNFYIVDTDKTMSRVFSPDCHASVIKVRKGELGGFIEKEAKTSLMFNRH